MSKLEKTVQKLNFWTVFFLHKASFSKYTIVYIVLCYN